MKAGEKIEVFERDGKLYFNVVCEEYGHNCTFSEEESLLAIRYLIADESDRENLLFEGRAQ